MRVLLAFLVLFTLAGCGSSPAARIAAVASAQPGRTQDYGFSPARTQVPAEPIAIGGTQNPVTRADLDAEAGKLAGMQAAWDSQQQANQQAWVDRFAYGALALAVAWAGVAGVLLWFHGITLVTALEVGTPLVVIGLLLLELSHYLPRSGPWLIGLAAAAVGVHFLAHRWRTLRPALTKCVDALVNPLAPVARQIF